MYQKTTPTYFPEKASENVLQGSPPAAHALACIAERVASSLVKKNRAETGRALWCVGGVRGSVREQQAAKKTTMNFYAMAHREGGVPDKRMPYWQKIETAVNQ